MQGFQPGKHKAAQKNYAGGGMVRGPGTGTSDDIPAKVKTGSFVMPADTTKAVGFKPGMREVNLSDGENVVAPEQVAAIGAAVLELVKGATHTPAAMQENEPGEGPEHEGAESPQYEMAEDAEEQDQTRGFFADGGLVRRPASEEELKSAYDDWQSKKAPWYMPTPKANMEERAAEARYGDLLSGKATVPAAAPSVAAAPVAGFNPGAAPSPGVLDQRPAAPPAVPAPAVAKPVAPAAAPATPDAAGNVNVSRQANGVMEFSGTNVAGGVSYNGARAAGFKPSGAGVTTVPAVAGTPAAAGMPAGADAAPAAMAVAQPVVAPKDTGGFGLLDKDRIALRNAMIDAKQGDPGAGAVVQSLLKQQEAAPGDQLDREKLGADVAAGNANRALKATEIGAERGFRAGQLANDQARTALDAKRVNSDVEARGFEVGQARRLENLRAKYEAATDPKTKADLAQQLRTLSGKDEQANKFTVVPGGQEWDATAGVMRNVPGRVLNNQTGQFVDGAGAGKALPPLKDNTAAMTVVNDPSLSKDQRAAKLREMGYQ